MKTHQGDQKPISAFGISLLVLLGAALLCAVFMCNIRGLASEPGNTRLFTKRALGGGNCIGAWAVIEPNSHIIFASPKESPSAETGVCDIYTMNIDGTGRKQLTFSTDYDGQPVVSPDGKMIAFISERDGPSKVYLMNTDGMGLRKLTQGKFNDSIPVFSHDSSKVFFARRLSNDPDSAFSDELFSICIDGLNEQRLTDNKLWDAPVAGSGKTDMLYCLSGVYTPSGEMRMNLFQLDIQKQTRREVLPLAIRGNTGCAISPDEQWVTYVSDTEKPFEYEVYVCRMDGSNRRKLTNFHGYIGAIKFAPDGKHVVFVLETKGAPGRGRGDIYMASTDGKMLRKIGSNYIATVQLMDDERKTTDDAAKPEQK